jgi:hypothetical protein
MTSTMIDVPMRAAVVSLVVAIGSFASPLFAQDPPPRIPFAVVDVHGSIPSFPSDDPVLAASRGMNLAELPGSGLGAQFVVTVYPLRTRIVTFGIGGELAIARSRQTPRAGQLAADLVTLLRPAEESFRSLAPQISLNFGNGSGWSYLSGGLGTSTWSLAPQGLTDYSPNTDALKTINYGGGARWFIKPHVAFSFDVRFYAINPGTPGTALIQGVLTPLGPTPRTTLLFIGAGFSLKK